MGMDDHMLSCIKALAENRIQDAKKEAICCCLNDNTKKNAGKTAYYKKLLENGSTNMFELPANLRGLLYMKDVSDFREDRYYLGNQQKELFKQIERGVITTTKMLEYGIPYMNSTLIYGAPGTGKTEFAKYTAYKLGLPYAYLNFSYLIESYMGKTAQNLQRVFDYCKGQKCVLMLDEIDCIGLERGHDTGADGELGRTTIALMQALDGLVDGQVVIAMTNRCDRLDKALLRRFQRKVEFVPFGQEELENMIQTFMNSVDSSFLTDEILQYAEAPHTQAETVKYLIEKITEVVS
ncbi:ATP-dependent 26S proteasome regulatory subunit [butyrate-producing bacterium SS3/4]|nr:ATP-dependent 26S proteasome regulatory subunit [butyrate-producing bacterium SS3/4]